MHWKICTSKHRGLQQIGTVYDFTAYDSYVKWAARIMDAVLQTSVENDPEC